MLRADVRAASLSGAVLFLAGAALLLITSRLPQARPIPAPWLLALVAAAVVAAALMLVLDRLGRASLTRVYAFNLASLGLVAVLVAVSGGPRSPYAQYYLFAIVHTAAFQSRARLFGLLVVAAALFAAPGLYHADGAERFVTLAVVAIPPAVVAALAINSAVNALREERRRLSHGEAHALLLAEQDELTGLGNYRLFWRALKSEAARTRRHHEPFSLVLVDLDGFKAINDDLGHRVGDEALRRVAQALRGALRAEDVLCRQGGDEFGVIGVHAGPAEAHELARRLVEAVASAEPVHGSHRRLAASAGWATFGVHGETVEEVVAGADAALRRAKRSAAGPVAGAPAPPPSPAARERAGAPAASRSSAAGPGVSAAPRLAVLGGLARALTGTADEHAVAGVTVAHALGAVGGIAAAVARRGRSPEEAEVMAAGGRLNRLPAGPVGALGRGPLAPALEHHEPVVAPVRGDEGVAGMVLAPEARTALAAPIRAAGAVWGVLLLNSDRGDAYAPADVELVEALALQAGHALAWLATLTALSASSGAAGAALPTLPAVEPRRRVAELAVRVGRTLGLGAANLRALELGALLHDVGMVGVPAGVAGKPGLLSEEELALVREHPVLGERMLRPLPALREAASIVRHEHERYDGTGYPDGLGGEAIPLTSRLLLACIAYDAMTSPRPYRPALAPARAVEELRRAAGSQLDPAVVEALVSELGPAGAPAAAA